MVHRDPAQFPGRLTKQQDVQGHFKVLSEGVLHIRRASDHPANDHDAIELYN